MSKGIIRRVVSSPFGVEPSLTVFGNAPSPRPRERRRRDCATKAAPGASSTFRANSVPSQSLAKTSFTGRKRARGLPILVKPCCMGGDGFLGRKLRFLGGKPIVSGNEIGASKRSVPIYRGLASPLIPTPSISRKIHASFMAISRPNRLNDGIL